MLNCSYILNRPIALGACEAFSIRSVTKNLTVSDVSSTPLDCTTAVVYPHTSVALAAPLDSSHHIIITLSRIQTDR